MATHATSNQGVGDHRQERGQVHPGSVGREPDPSVAARNGCGLIQLPRYHVEDDLRSGHLVEVLADFSGPGFPITALYPHRRQLSPRVRIFLDWVGQLHEEAFGPTQAST